LIWLIFVFLYFVDRNGLVHGKTVDPNEFVEEVTPWFKPLNPHLRCCARNAKEFPIDGDDHRIVGGCEPCPGSYPWVVGLWRKFGRRPFCGGSLIHRRWMLTAAHCVTGQSAGGLKVVLGDHDVTKEEQGEVEAKVCKIHIHPDYQSVFQDVALLELCEPVKLTSKIKLIKYATKATMDRLKTKDVTVAGWGALKERERGSDVLMKVKVPRVDFQTCKGSYKWLRAGMICAGKWKEGGKDSCQGDSGGPLWTYDSKIRANVQLGIVSNGRGCARAGSPGVYTDVGYFNAWIEKTMNSKILEE